MKRKTSLPGRRRKISLSSYAHEYRLSFIANERWSLYEEKWLRVFFFFFFSSSFSSFSFLRLLRACCFRFFSSNGRMWFLFRDWWTTIFFSSFLSVSYTPITRVFLLFLFFATSRRISINSNKNNNAFFMLLSHLSIQLKRKCSISHCYRLSMRLILKEKEDEEMLDFNMNEQKRNRIACGWI